MRRLSKITTNPVVQPALGMQSLLPAIPLRRGTVKTLEYLIDKG